MKVSLIYPPIVTFSHASRMVHLPYGLAVLQSFLRKQGVSTNIDDINALLFNGV